MILLLKLMKSHEKHLDSYLIMAVILVCWFSLVSFRVLFCTRVTTVIEWEKSSCDGAHTKHKEENVDGTGPIIIKKKDA